MLNRVLAAATAGLLLGLSALGQSASADEHDVAEGRLWEVLWRKTAASPPPPDPRYPVVLADTQSQRQLGLLVSNYGPYKGGPELANKCFYYGDGGNLLSVSDAFLATYTARGFSKATLCLGLVSSIKFNPETGKRLATVIMADLKVLGSPNYVGEPGPITDEIPVDIPNCFSRGLPLVDCRFAYHPFTGARLNGSDTDLIAREGARALNAGRELMAAGNYSRPCRADESARKAEDESCYSADSESVRGYLSREYRINANHPIMLPFGGFYSFDPALGEGFAYAIFADGAAGPSASMESVTLALNGKNRASSASLDALKIAAGGG
jgi:hypothetical protein